MKAYPSYKDSGAGWLGEIPSHWIASKIKYLCYVSDGNHGEEYPEETDFTDELNGVPFIRVTEFDGWSITKKGILYITKEKNNSMRKGGLQENDILFVNRGSIGKVALVSKEFVGANLNSQIAYFRTQSPNAHYKYLLYFVVSGTFQNMVSSLIHGGALVQLPLKRIIGLEVACPPLSEQQAIADFLDRKTAQIDTLIEKKQRQIDLLQEQRTALINHAVTKGLNPDVRMKDSGVEWLGEIPSHWIMSRLKFVCSLLKDGSHIPPSRHDKGIPLLSVRNIVDGKFINLPDDSLISIEDFKILTKPFEVLENDVLLAIVGATLGKVAIVEKMPPFFIQRSLAIFRPKSEVYLFKFLYYFFRSSNFQSRLWSSVGFSAQPGIYLGTLGNIHCPIPPIEELKQMVSFIETEEKIIADTIYKVRSQIDLLHEYRTALISEAVTGKIDVRNL